jgi:uncharacterized protein
LIWTAFAASFVDAGKDVADVEAALDGARDIIAEWVSENPDTRKGMCASCSGVKV